MSRNFISVYFLDNSFKTLAMDESMTCEDLSAQVCEEIELTQAKEDFRFFVFNNSQELIVDPSQNPLKYLAGADIRNGINPLANKLVFKRAFFRGAEEEITCEELKHLMFHQARSYFLAGLWPTTFDLAVTLAGLLISVSYGDNSDVDKPGFLGAHFKEFLPPLHTKKLKAKVIEPKLIASHRNNAGLSPKEAQQRFYDTIRENCVAFGTIPYPASCVRFGDKKVKGKVYLAVGCEGVHILNANDLSVISFLQFSRLKGWNAQAAIFTIGVLAKEGDTTSIPYVFETVYSSQLAMMLKTYVDRMIVDADGDSNNINNNGDDEQRLQTDVPAQLNDNDMAAYGDAAQAAGANGEEEYPEEDEEEEEEEYDYGDEDDI